MVNSTFLNARYIFVFPLIAINPCSESNRLLPRKCRLFAPGKDAVENFFAEYRAHSSPARHCHLFAIKLARQVYGAVNVEIVYAGSVLGGPRKHSVSWPVNDSLWRQYTMH